MSEPPPTPLAVSALMPSKRCSSKRPCRPLPGSHSAPRHCRGVRGNEPGGHGWPRSSTTTDAPACASRQPTVDPPKPEPTTATSKRSACASPAIDPPLHRVARVGLVGAERARPDRRGELATEPLVLVADAAD